MLVCVGECIKNMRILLDTKDLIDLVERDRPVRLERVNDIFRAAGHHLVISFSSVGEFCAPVLSGGDLLDMRHNLQRLERLPLAYIREAYIPFLEIASALEAFKSGGDYAPINPYVQRWDNTVQQPWVPSATGSFVGYRIDEAVIDILRTNPEAIKGAKKNIEAYRLMLDADRNLPQPPPVIEQFERTITRHLARYPLETVGVDLAKFSKWIYEKPSRCPGLRLTFDKYNLIRGDQQHRAQPGDFNDFAHLTAIPYVDAITLDRRVVHLANATLRNLDRKHGFRVATLITKNSNELFNALFLPM